MTRGLQLGLFWNSLKHTRPHQLGARLESDGETQAEFAVLARPLAQRRLRGNALATQSILPQPIFPQRESLATWKHGSYADFRQLNLNFPLTQPMRWNPEELLKGTHLELLTLHYMEYLRIAALGIGPRPDLGLDRNKQTV